MEYPWPGNVRELENFIERAVVTSQGKILIPSDFPRELAFGKTLTPEAIEVGCSISEAEKRLILKTLESEGGNRTKAAEILGISTRTLRNKLQEYGLSEFGSCGKEESGDQ
jgi:DNA-binding NtrC family response regulator